MDILSIKSIVNSDQLPEDMRASMIISVLAKDKEVIPLILEIIDVERKQKEELIVDMNLELSRAEVHIKNPTLASGINSTKAKDEELKLAQAKEFVLNHITAFYVKYKEVINHCFNKQV